MSDHVPPALIPYHDRLVGGDTIPTVDGRDLHTFLAIARDYADWIKRQIKRAGLVEHRDYEVSYTHVENPLGGRPSVEYFVSFDAAKHIGMLSNTDKGRQVREYFLACEKAVTMARTRPHDVVDLFPELKAIQELVVSVARYRQEQEALRAAQARTQAVADKAVELSHLALRGQHWLTIRQYVFLHDLQRQMPLSVQQDYARWLGGYCLERDIAMYKAQTADRAWHDERTYAASAIDATLPGWLKRHASGLTLLDRPQEVP
jgi:phage anti-repressor protein